MDHKALTKPIAQTGNRREFVFYTFGVNKTTVLLSELDKAY